MMRWLIYLIAFSGSVCAQDTDSLLGVLANAKADTHRVTLLYQFGNAFWKKSNDSLSKSYLNRAVGFAQKIKHPRREADARLADSLYKNEKDYSEMLGHNSQANFGQIFQAKKQYAQVIPYARKGLEYTADANLPGSWNGNRSGSNSLNDTL